MTPDDRLTDTVDSTPEPSALPSGYPDDDRTEPVDRTEIAGALTDDSEHEVARAPLPTEPPKSKRAGTKTAIEWAVLIVSALLIALLI